MKRNTLLLALLLFCSACVSNHYESFYSPLPRNEFLFEQRSPKVIEIVDQDQLDALMKNDDFILIGTSLFYQLWTPRSLAIECAKKHGASLVAVGYTIGETVKSESVEYHPVSYNTYHSGSIAGHPYAGTSTSYGAIPVVTHIANTYYHQYGYFFAKRKYKNNFGVYFQFPDNIPGNKEKEIRIQFVATGSLAERKGFKAGDVVRSINGNLIQSPADLIPFIKGEKEILSMEVAP